MGLLTDFGGEKKDELWIPQQLHYISFLKNLHPLSRIKLIWRIK